ncbi:TPA: lytic transglycosylase domain-containing protein [Pasteurella multocida]|nr:lytic transglycosylase domain-containing protein [Pasteurella multocida]HDX1177495.1 lytic transglycosylase domain-containing protein [Pasteurella multocida]
MAITTILQLIATCAPLIHPDTAFAVMSEESKFNRFAIGVVDGYIKQPQDLPSALEAVKDLEKEGKNYSVGIMQINKNNFNRYNVTIKQMFEPCENLKVAQKILIDCYERGKSVNNALSCYYSGNFIRGYKKDFRGTSYVERVHSQPRPQNQSNFAVPSLRDEPIGIEPKPVADTLKAVIGKAKQDKLTTIKFVKSRRSQRTEPISDIKMKSKLVF